MARVKRGVQARRRHKKVLKQAKGYYGARSRVFRVAKQAVIKAGQYAYRDRRQRKRQFRRLWIARINAAARINGLSYSRFMNGLKRRNRLPDRKVLADLAVREQAAFHAIAEKAKQALAAIAVGLIELGLVPGFHCRTEIETFMQVEQIQNQALDAVGAADSIEALEALRVQYLGKKGELTSQLKALGKMEPEARKEAGAKVNQAKQQVESAIAANKQN